MYEMMQKAIIQFGSERVAMRRRRFLESKKLRAEDRFPTKIFDDKAGFHDITYQQLGDKIAAFGCGLIKLGMTSIPSHGDKQDDSFANISGDFKMVIFESTCPEWTIALHGAFSKSMTVATCYATLGHDAVVSAVQETQAAALMVNHKDVASFVARISEMPTLKIIIASLNELGKSMFTPQDSNNNVKIVTSEQVMEMGREHDCKPTPPKVR